MARRLAPVLAAFILAAVPFGAAAQGTEVPFGEGFRQDTSAPVEVTADRLSVDQADGTAVFSGNVLIVQGDMRLAAGAVRVFYAPADAADAQGRIERLEASGGVTLVAGSEAAEAQEAVYTIDQGNVVMTGDVVVTQGSNALSSQKLTVNLVDGTGVLEGRVRTVLSPRAAP